jgi:hypothetical protein
MPTLIAYAAAPAHRQLHPSGQSSPTSAAYARPVARPPSACPRGWSGSAGSTPGSARGGAAEQPPDLGQQVAAHGERPQLRRRLAGGEELGQHPLAGATHAIRRSTRRYPAGPIGRPPTRSGDREHQQRQQHRMQHREHAGRGRQPDHVRCRSRCCGPPAAARRRSPRSRAAVHGVPPLRIVERGQFDPGGELEQPHLGRLVDHGRQPAVCAAVAAADRTAPGGQRRDHSSSDGTAARTRSGVGPACSSPSNTRPR